MPKYPPPSPPFIAARWHGGSQTPAKRIVIHGTVSPCEAGGARNIAHFFATETGKTSAHYVVDPGEVIQCVGDHAIAYHAPPNTDSIGVELCDPQTGAGSRWADADHVAMLALAAELVAQLCLAYDVPIKKIGSSQLVGGEHGICGHVDVSNAWHQTTHTDPGPDFPWASFMAQVQDAADVITGTAPNPSPPAPTPSKPTQPTEDDMPYKTWPQADKDALLTDVTNAVITAISNRQLIDTSEVGAGGKDQKSSLPYAVKLLLRQNLAAVTALGTLTGVGPDVAAIRAQVEKDAPSA